MPAQYYATDGLVLRKVPYAEADFLVRVLTRDFGKIDILAKGARKPASKLNPHLDILNFIRVSFVQNSEHLPTLIDAEIVECLDDCFLDADRIVITGKILKTIDALIYAGERDAGLLDIVFLSLRALQSSNPDLKKISSSFIDAFLVHEGYGERTDYSLLPSEVTDTIMNVWSSSSI